MTERPAAEHPPSPAQSEAAAHAATTSAASKAAARRRAGRPPSPLAPLSPEEQAQLRRFLLRWSRPGCGLALTFALTLAVWTLATLHPRPVLWLLGALLTPWTTPVVGLAVGLVLGSRAVLRRAALVLLGLGLAAWGVGYALGRALPPTPDRLVWAWVAPDLTAFVVTVVAAVWAVVLLARRQAAALLPGAALTWAIALPLFAAGLAAGQGEAQWAGWAWLAFAAHLLWAWLMAGVALMVLGVYPRGWGGYGLLLMFLALAVAVFAPYAAADVQRAAAQPRPGVVGEPTPAAAAGPGGALPPTPSPHPTPTPTAMATPTPSRPTPTLTPTPAAAVATYTVVWPTPTVSPTPTPIYAVVQASQRYTGIYVREGPGFDYPAFTGLLNGTLVQVLPGEPVEADGLLWVQVRFEEFGRVKEGWVLYPLLLLVTPTPTPLE